ncbi:MAG: hypothetical protein JW772_05665 [Candidatus Diapherotrites archaeon]|nr:hypothetical protein [Candidatus Diapherotrites archaeon]
MANFWDFLRPLDQIAVSMAMPVSVIVLIISIAIFAVSIMAYLKVKSRRMLFVSAAFFFFMLNWLLKTIDQFISPGMFFSVAAQGIVELIILGLLFLAILKK